MEIGHTIAVVNKSGKVVSTSKHLMGVFKEAKAAYRERKAEIVAERQAKVAEKEALRAIEAMNLAEDTQSHYSGRSRSRRHHRSHHPSTEVPMRPIHERQYSAASFRTTNSRSNSVSPRTSSRAFEYDEAAHAVPSSSAPVNMPILRRHTTHDVALAYGHPQPLVRASSTSAIDMDLAYGTAHPKSLAAYSPENSQKDFSGLVTQAKKMLDEADCAHASVTAMIAHLQKNPEAMAAVALTLAEISNLATKMAPTALTALKASAPAVFALLASPQFLIAAGVGVGITVVMLGGYKIIKKIKAKHDLGNVEGNEAASMDEMMEVTSDLPNLDRIENWRRGIADSHVSEFEGSATGRSVEGEFITPLAAGIRRERGAPMAMAMRSNADPDSGSKKSGKTKKKKGKHGDGSGKSKAARSDSGTSDDKKKQLVRVKKPSPLQRMFT